MPGGFPQYLVISSVNYQEISKELLLFVTGFQNVMGDRPASSANPDRNYEARYKAGVFISTVSDSASHMASR